MGSRSLLPSPVKARLAILVAADNSLMRSGLRAILGQRDGWAITGLARTTQEAVNKARELRPDLLILDLDMRGYDGLDAVEQILRLSPKMRVLLLSTRATSVSLRRALALCVDGFVLKSDRESYILDAVEAIQRGDAFISPSVTSALREGIAVDATESRTQDADKTLTRREREVVRFVAEGKSNKEVAALLDISLRTAENHRAHAMKKLKLRSFSELVRFAVRVGLVEP